LITPWNWPQNQISLKVIAALIAGCTTVLKPSEESPLNAIVFAECIDAAGFPKGVFNLVNGDGTGVGTALTTHPDVDMVSFTGSTRAGIAISKAAADTLKRVHLELGGKGANILFADADDDAIDRGVRQMMSNSGQSCNAPSRMLVQREIYSRAVERAAQIANTIEVRPAQEEGSF
ncbi:MAG: aldehyde dehydrogenase family protein, partial [Microthrixaceae bacterium]|nr:aldehyde dehydrogenase family protein [Microthrixaceae bacterium]